MIKAKWGSEGAKQHVKTEEDTHDVDHIAKFELSIIILTGLLQFQGCFKSSHCISANN